MDRLLTREALFDLHSRALDRRPFTWGGRELADAGAARTTYLAALRALDVDRDDIEPLLAFARS